jgi:2-amino-4-hydroxy-6-hydroxymethyldihydropteridine diphosphokinase
MAYDEGKENEVYLSLGSNLGNRKENILKAVEMLEHSLHGQIIISPFYESKAVGFESDSKFLNICAKTKTKMSPQELLNIIHEIELKLGRVRSENHEYIDRLIDIDILFHGKRIIKSKNLTIPHPEFYHRKFVLIPLHDIAKNLVDPISKKEIKTILSECNDKSELILCEN